MKINYRGWVIEQSKELKINSRGLYEFEVYHPDLDISTQDFKTLKEAKEYVDLYIEENEL